jgi:branched-chain amino acid aminotransferase
MSTIQNNSFPYIFFENNIVKTEDAKVSIMTHALQYGTGLFGGMRGYYNKKEGYLSVFRIKDHYKRFLQSLQILGVRFPYSQKQLEEITLDLIKKNNPQTDVYFRPFAYEGSLQISPALPKDSTFAFSLYMIPLGDYLPTDTGITAMVSSWRRISDNAIPSRVKASGAYINSALAKQEAIMNGFDEAIFLSENGHVAEGSAMNIFIVRDGVLITPPKTDDILEGIMRRTIMQVAKDEGIPVEERTIDRTELYIADEAFFSGTGAQFVWIKSIDHRIIGNGEMGTISQKLQGLFFEIVRGNSTKYKDWCTKINL